MSSLARILTLVFLLAACQKKPVALVDNPILNFAPENSGVFYAWDLKQKAQHSLYDLIKSARTQTNISLEPFSMLMKIVSDVAFQASNSNNEHSALLVFAKAQSFNMRPSFIIGYANQSQSVTAFNSAQQTLKTQGVRVYQDQLENAQSFHFRYRIGARFTFIFQIKNYLIITYDESLIQHFNHDRSPGVLDKIPTSLRHSLYEIGSFDIGLMLAQLDLSQDSWLYKSIAKNQQLLILRSISRFEQDLLVVPHQLKINSAKTIKDFYLQRASKQKFQLTQDLVVDLKIKPVFARSLFQQHYISKLPAIYAQKFINLIEAAPEVSGVRTYFSAQSSMPGTLVPTVVLESEYAANLAYSLDELVNAGFIGELGMDIKTDQENFQGQQVNSFIIPNIGSIFWSASASQLVFSFSKDQLVKSKFDLEPFNSSAELALVLDPKLFAYHFQYFKDNFMVNYIPSYILSPEVFQRWFGEEQRSLEFFIGSENFLLLSQK